MNKVLPRQKTAWKNIGQMLQVSNNTLVASILFYIIAVILQWLPNYEEFWLRMSSDALSFSDKISDIFGGFLNLFREINDLTPITFLLIALFQALSLTMLIKMKNSRKRDIGGVGVALVGSGCVACGGSLLSPILSLVATNLSITAANAIGDIVLVFATILSYMTLIKVALR